MTYYHAVFLGEDGMEFGAGTHADSKEEAYDTLSENYPESRIVQLESPEDTAAREARIYAQALCDEWDDEIDEDFVPVDWESLGYDSEEDYLADNCLN